MSTGLKITIGSIFLVAIIIIGSLWYFTRDSSEELRTIEVKKTTVTQDIEFTGNLKSANSVDLSFETSGTIAEILVGEGDSVKAGQAIAVLDPSISELELAQATASQLAAAEQKQILLQNAENTLTRTKDLNTKTVDKKRQSVRDAKKELDQARNVHNQTDTDNGQSATTETALATLKAKETAYQLAKDSLEEAIASAEKSSQSAVDSVTSAKATYLATIQASGRSGAISALQAAREIARLRLGQKTVYAPFDGVLTTRHQEVGETAIAGTIVATIETVNTLELTANATESDAAKISVNMPATITFDALPQQDQWTANVEYVAPAAKTIEGVPTYEIKLQLSNYEDQRLKPGLTTNIIVHAAEKQDILAIPRRAVITKGSQQLVFILNDEGEAIEQVVSTGLIGTDGQIEITQGLSEGQRVIIETTSLRDQQ